MGRGRPKKYFTEEERKEAQREYQKQYYQDNKEYKRQYQKQYKKQYRQTPMGRALYLISGYKRSDKKYNRGECTLTPEWIVENIFTKPCHYCGETDWTKMGCDRIDNSKPHTPDNVVPCCDKCNRQRGRKDYEEFMLETMLIQ